MYFRSQRENTTDDCFRSRAGCLGRPGAFARNARYDTACRTSKCRDFGCRPQCGDTGIRRHARYESARRRETWKTLRHDPTMRHLFRRELETNWQRPARRGKDRALASSGMVRAIFKQGTAAPRRRAADVRLGVRSAAQSTPATAPNWESGSQLAATKPRMRTFNRTLRCMDK